MQEPKLTHHAARQPTGHECKADKQEEPCSPDRLRRAVIITSDSILVDDVDDEHANEGAYSRDPVYKFDMDWWRDLGVAVG